VRTFSVAASLLGLLACKPTDGYVRDATTPWMTGTTLENGECSFMLDAAYLTHEYDWAGGVRITATNAGAEQSHCSWDAMIVTGGGKALSSREGWSGSLGPGSSSTDYVELTTKYTLEGEEERPWLYVGTSAGWNPTQEDGASIVDPASEPPY
jgi:hypothetical protein